jgi:hypothetical protein
MKQLLVLISVLFSMSIFAQDYKIIELYPEEGVQVAYITPKEIYVVFDYIKKYSVIDRKYLKLGKDGFLRLHYFDTTYLIIEGKYVNQYFYNTNNNIRYDSNTKNLYFQNRNLKSITSSSYLTETINGKQVKYTPDNLFKAFYIECTDLPYVWNSSHVPWVEGTFGKGIGESITIDFDKTIDGFSILNGFVDIEKTRLYKENSRIKKLTILDLENHEKQIVEFEDRVYFKLIEFDKSTTQIKLIINDIYPGSKYSDTCVSAIVDHQRIFDNGDSIEEEVKNKIEEIKTKYERVEYFKIPIE